MAIFSWVLCSFRTPSRALGPYTVHLKGGIPFYDGVGINCENGTTTGIKAQEPSMWAKGCMVGDCASVIGLDMTTPPDGGKMSWNIIPATKLEKTPHCPIFENISLNMF